MDKKLKAKWVKALRSGRYKQGRVYMYNDGRYCCLGVLACVMGHNPAKEGQDRYDLALESLGNEPMYALIGLNDDLERPPFEVIAGFVDATL